MAVTSVMLFGCLEWLITITQGRTKKSGIAGRAAAAAAPLQLDQLVDQPHFALAPRYLWDFMCLFSQF